MKAKLFVNGFLLYYLFAIIGSNLYIGITGLSFGNVALVFITIAIIISKGTINLNQDQKSFLFPVLLLLVLITIYLIGYLDVADANVIAKYFYLTNIPLLAIIIFSFGNNYTEYFYRKIYLIIKIILLLLVTVVLIELVFNIHMPTYETAERIFNIPTAFFGNSNDVGAIVVSVFLLFIAFNQRYGNRKGFFIYTAITAFLVVATFSRLAFVVLFLIFPFYFVIVRQKSFRFVFITFMAAVSLIYIFSTVVVNYIPNKEVDQYGWINNRLLSIKDKDIYNAKGSSSYGIRYSIYSYPFKNPEKFIIGYGINGDEGVLKNEIRWSGITNAHSFFMEIVYDFGWLGLFLVLWFFVAIIVFSIQKGKSMQYRYSLLFIGSFMILINISSSIFGKPIIWAPLFVYLSFLTTKNSDLEITDEANI